MTKESVWMTDYHATLNHHFEFKLGERVGFKDGDFKGIVQNALLESDCGAYEITYHIQTDDGDIFKVLESNLVSLEILLSKHSG
jgi:hypothetical protein